MIGIYQTYAIVMPFLFSISDPLMNGKKLYEDGMIHESIAEFDKAIAKDHKNKMAYYYKGIALLSIAKNDEAIKALNESIIIDPVFIDAMRARATLYTRNKKFEEALQEINKCIEIDPKSYISYQVKSEILFYYGDYNNALINANVAQELNPSSDTNLLLAEIYRRLGDNSKALIEINKAIKFDNNNSLYYFKRGRINDSLKNVNDSLRDYTLAIDKDKEYADAYAYRSLIRLKIGDCIGAESDSDYSIKLQPRQAQWYIFRGFIEKEQNRQKTALEKFASAIQIDPGNAEAYYNKGVVYKDIGNFNQAIVDLTFSIKFDPKSNYAYAERGIVYCKMNKWGEAIKDFDQLVSIMPTDAGGYLLRARVRSICPDPKMRNGALALLDATKACELTKWQLPEALEALAQSYAELKDYSSAIKWQEKAVKILNDSKCNITEHVKLLEQYKALLSMK